MVHPTRYAWKSVVAALMLLPLSSSVFAETAAIAARPRIPVASVELTAPKAKLLAGETMALQARALDAAGQPIASAKLKFIVTPPTVAKVSRGVLTAKKGGTAQVVALVGTVRSTPLSISVNQITRIVISPAQSQLINAGDTLVFTAQVFDAFGNSLPNEEFPVVPLTWKSSAGRAMPITQRGALYAGRFGATVVSASVGRTKSLGVRVIAQRRDLARSTRVFLTGQPLAGVQSLCVSFDSIQVKTPSGAWQTLLTGREIHALVGQPIDVLQLVNRRIQIGTGFLPPDPSYQEMRMVMNPEPGANYLVQMDGTRVDLSFDQPEHAVRTFPFFIGAGPGMGLSVGLDFRSALSFAQRADGSWAYKPDVDASVLFDEDLQKPIGALVGTVAPAMAGDIWLMNEDDGGNITNFFGSIDPATGNFRVGQVPAGRYVLNIKLGVASSGPPDVVIPNIVILPGQDTALPGPVIVGGEEG
jgi:hypothetical protein